MIGRSFVKYPVLGLVGLALLYLGVRPFTPVAAQPAPAPSIDLSGKWVYSGNNIQSAPVRILDIFTPGTPDAARTDRVVALFDGSVSCPAGGSLTELFEGTLDVSTGRTLGAYTLSGDTFQTCSQNNQFNRDCGLLDPYATQFRAEVSLDGGMISGEFLGVGYNADMDHGRYTNCRLDSRYDSWKSFTLTRPGGGCDALQRGYDQEKALLDTIDAQRQAAQNAADSLAPQMAALAQQIAGVQSDAQQEWDQAGLGNAATAFITVVGDLVLDGLAPEAESLIPEATPGAVFDAAEAIQEYISAVSAHYGDLDQLHEWAVEQSAQYDMSALLKMVDLLEQQADVGGKAAVFNNQFNSLRGSRDAEAQKVADAKAALDACLAAQ